MGKLIFTIFILFPFQCVFSLVPENFLQNDQELLEKLAIGEIATKAKVKLLKPKDRFNYIRKDPQNLISDTFDISPFFNDSVHFWFNIYTLYDSNYSVIHDKDNLGIIYEVVDFNDLADSILNRHTKAALQSRLTLSKAKQIKTALKNLGDGKKHELNDPILKSITAAGVKVPESAKEKQKFFHVLASNVRAQTGQRNHIVQGIHNIVPYSNNIKSYFLSFKLPQELIAIPFLESSFNPHAESRVGAAGAWQFMRRIAQYFMVVSTKRDDRLNPFISTISALHLLKQNKKILGRWDLSVAAYNSGTKHLIRAKKILKIKEPSLEYILQHYSHPHIGFAAKNFYSEFLALVYALAYKNILFSDLDKTILDPEKTRPHADLYLTLCSFKPKKLFDSLKNESSNIKSFNSHLIHKFQGHTFPRGTIILSDTNLTSRRYYKVSLEDATKIYPKNYSKFIKDKKGYNCSIK